MDKNQKDDIQPEEFDEKLFLDQYYEELNLVDRIKKDNKELERNIRKLEKEIKSIQRDIDYGNKQIEKHKAKAEDLFNSLEEAKNYKVSDEEVDNFIKSVVIDKKRISYNEAGKVYKAYKNNKIITTKKHMKKMYEIADVRKLFVDQYYEENKKTVDLFICVIKAVEQKRYDIAQAILRKVKVN